MQKFERDRIATSYQIMELSYIETGWRSLRQGAKKRPHHPIFIVTGDQSGEIYPPGIAILGAMT